MGQLPKALFPTGLTDNVFDTHTGLLAAAILDRLTDLMYSSGGVIIRTTADTGLQVIDAGAGKISVKAGIGYDKFGQRLYIAADDAGSGIYVGTVDLSSGVDLSTNKLIKLDINNAGAIEIDCQGGTPAATTIDEIMAAINAAGFGSIAYRSDVGGNPITSGAYLTIKSATVGGASEVEFQAPSATDATAEIFGLDEGAYNHTYVGGGGYAVTDDSTTYNVIIEHQVVKSVPGNFESGYPLVDGDKYTQQTDGYKVTVTTDTPISDGNQHELLLAQVSNTGGTLTITDNRENVILRLQGFSDVDTTPPDAPTKVFLKSLAGHGANSKLSIKWNKVEDASGIKAYKIKLTLIETDGVAVSPVEVEEVSNYSFDPTAATIEQKILRPNGNKYQVHVAAMDNAVNQNLSPWTNFGTIVNGLLSAGVEDDEEVIPIVPIGPATMVPLNNAVNVEWEGSETAESYEVAYTVDGGRPSFAQGNTQETSNPNIQIPASPGQEVQVIVRPKNRDHSSAEQQEVKGIAGGAVIGANEKQLTVFTKSVLATADGKAARELGRARLANPADINELAAVVTGLALNGSARAVIRAYRDNNEADAITLIFTANGPVELAMDEQLQWDSGWVIFDAYDSAESGASQAAFTMDGFVTYAEGQVQRSTTKSSTRNSSNL
jgi:hypothetical protein